MERQDVLDKRICDIYDRNPNLTLAQLSKLTGKPITYLKKILMKG